MCTRRFFLLLFLGSLYAPPERCVREYEVKPNHFGKSLCKFVHGYFDPHTRAFLQEQLPEFSVHVKEDSCQKPASNKRRGSITMDFYEPNLNKKTSVEKLLPNVITESLSCDIPKKGFCEAFYILLTQQFETYRQKTSKIAAENSKSELTVCVAWGASETRLDYLSIIDIGTDD